MANNNVNIKLTADGSQVRSELKLIDQDLSKLGKGSTPNNSGQGRSASSQSQSQQHHRKDEQSELGREDRNQSNSQQRNEAAERTRLYREITLIRKELQKFNRDGGFSGYSGSGQSQSTGSSQQSSSSPQPSVSTGNGGGGGTGTGGFGSSSSGSGSTASAIGSAVGKALTSGLILAGLHKAKNYLSTGYQQEVSAEHKAYDTYGSSLAYTDYKQAKEQARDMGISFGYDHSEVMAANKSYMQSGAGWTDAGSNMVNMTDILGTAHATGVDTTSLANAAGEGEAMGIDTSAFMTMFTNSIEKAGMTGREEEQLSVLNTIADLLHETNVTVSEQKTADSLAVYNALVEGNENLKGQAGAAMWTDLNSAVTSGNTQMLRALGYGTELAPGMEGYMEALRRASEGATTENLNRVMDYYVNTVGVTDKTQLEYMVGNAFGGLSAQNIQEMDELMNNYFQYDEKTGSWNKRENTSEGLLDKDKHEGYVSERTQNYQESDLGIEEKYQLQKQDTQEDMGNIWGSNPIAMKLKEWYSGLSPSGRVGATVAGGAATLVGGSILSNLIGKGIGKMFGAGSSASGAGSAGGSWFTNIFRNFGRGGSTTGEAGEAASGLGEAIRNASNAVGNGKDFASGLGKGLNEGIGGRLWNWGSNIGKNLVGGVDETAEILDDAGNVIGRTSASVSEAGSIASEIANIGGSADEAGTALSTIGNAANYSDEAADVVGAIGNAANYTDDAARAAAGVSEAAGATSALGKAGNVLGKAALPIAIGAEVVSTGIDVSEAKKRGDDREAAQELGGGVGGVAGAVGGTILGGIAAGAATGAVAGSVAPGIGNLIGAGVGAVVGLGTGIAASIAGEKIGEASYDATHDGYEFTDEQLEQIHKYYEKVQDIYDKKDDYNGKTGSNAAQDYVKEVVTPYLNSIGVSTSHTDAYKTDVGKNDFLKDVDKGLYGESGEDWEPIEKDTSKSESEPKVEETMTPEFTGDQLSQIKTYADEVQKIYDEQGGNAAQDYVNKTVKPYLESIGVSEKVTNKYKLDVGKNDFLKDVDKGEFGDLSGVSAIPEFTGTSGTYGMPTTGTLGINNETDDIRYENNRPYDEYIGDVDHVEGTNWSDAATEETTENIEETVTDIRDLIRDGNLFKDNTTQLSDTLENDDNEENKTLFSKLASKTGSFFSGLFGGSPDGSHATGNDYIPYDNYLAELHKGEMVLTQSEADDYRSGGIYAGTNYANMGQSMRLDINVNGNIDGMTAENQAQIVQAVIAQINSPNLMNMLSTSFQRVQNY